MRQTDVLIIGAGPTGLTLALELSVQGTPFILIDTLPSASPYSRALVLHPRSLELLARHASVLDSLLPKANGNLGVRSFVKKRFVFEFDFTGVDHAGTRFGHPVMVSQAETEGALEACLQSYGGVVERGVSATSVLQDEPGVTAVLKKSDGSTEEVRAKYAVGCDGAHSVVRKAAGLQFNGSVYPQDFILADVHLGASTIASDRLSIYMASGSLLVFPLKGGIYRLVASRGVDKLGDESEPTLEDFRRVVSALVPGDTEVVDATWLARFRLHHRIVDSFRKERLFVAGDAAHIHSPAGGQGMNTGIQDAVNLGWKLASALRSSSPGNETLLDSYNTERRKVGEKLLAGTDNMFQMMATTNPVYLWLRNTLVPWVGPWVMQGKETQLKRFLFVSQLGIRYRNSAIVGTATGWHGALKGGDRAPDGELRTGEGKEGHLLGLIVGGPYHLVLFSGVGSEAAENETLEAAVGKILGSNEKGVRAHKIFRENGKGSDGWVDGEGALHDQYGFTEPGYVLIRPDGYIAHIGPLSAADEVADWWRK